MTATVRMLAGFLLAAAASAASAATAQEQPPAPEQGKTAVALVYSKAYQINLGGLERMHPFDIHKYSKIAQQLVKDGLATESDFLVPKELTREEILTVQSARFLDSLKDSATVAQYLEAPIAKRLPAVVIDRGMLRPFRYASGGTVAAARAALKHGVAINLGGGYHHAKPDRGEGFCIYADMPIAIRILQRERLIRRALVVDLDVHQGNGTIVCCHGDESVFTFSMHEAGIYPIPKEKGDRDIELAAGTGDEAYLRTLRDALPEVIRQSRPDIVLLQAGCDPLAGDPLANLAMTKEGIVARDALVIDACVARKIPVVMLLGGGYSREAWEVQHASIRRTLEKYAVVRRQEQPATKPGLKKFLGKKQK
ncbi:MAG: histone deacetylase [Candidatus Nealsonbacteria bacterium]|nr:histone deacetylase [Candidatus Nealsonbacteria bacterium]